MEHEVYGYCRVSSRDQHETRQLVALLDAKVPIKNIFVDKQSGKDFERKMYKRMIKRMKGGDLLYIKSIDRLGRNYREIVEQWRLITKEKNVDIVVIDMPLLDTRQGKDLIGTFLSDIVLQILSFVAENERESIHRRQREGIEAAKASGTKFGRPRKPLPVNFYDVYQMWKAREITISEAAKECSMPRSTFFVKAKDTIRKEQSEK